MVIRIFTLLDIFFAESKSFKWLKKRLLMWIKAHSLSLSIKKVKDNEKCERDINPYSLGYERVF